MSLSTLDDLFRPLRESRRGKAPPPVPVPVPPFDDGQDGGGDDDEMEQRLRAIEDRLLTVETKSNGFATKDDVRAVEATAATRHGGV
jgi:hypothetical protein